MGLTGGVMTFGFDLKRSTEAEEPARIGAATWGHSGLASPSENGWDHAGGTGERVWWVGDLTRPQ